MFEKEAEKYLKKLLKRLKIKEEDLVENQPKFISWEKMNFISLNVSNVSKAFQDGAKFGYNKANEWHYVKDELPPNPKESGDGISILPLNYICAYDCGDGDYECDEFMYLGDGVWNGENKNYPIYAWMDCAVEVPFPRKESE